MQALARPAGGRPREPVPEPVGEPVAREDRREVLAEELADEALESRAHVWVPGSEAVAEAGAEGPVTDQDTLSRQAERGEIARAIEAVAEVLEARGVLGRIETQDEAGRRLPHARQGPVNPGTEEIHAAVGHARGEESGQLDVGGIGVPEGELDRVLLHPQSPVELAAEPIERLLEPIRH